LLRHDKETFYLKTVTSGQQLNRYLMLLAKDVQTTFFSFGNVMKSENLTETIELQSALPQGPERAITA